MSEELTDEDNIYQIDDDYTIDRFIDPLDDESDKE